LDAAELLEHNQAHRLELVRSRAEKWTGGLTALTGLLGAVLVGKAPENIRAVAAPERAIVGILLALALAALVFATYRAYQAAYGDPGRLDQLPPQPLTGLAERLFTARTTAAHAANTHLRHAATATLTAITLLTAATGITWYAPTNTTTLCLLIGGKPAAELSTTTLTIRTTTAGITLGPCP
jgi:hypothetical protein